MSEIVNIRDSSDPNWRSYPVIGHQFSNSQKVMYCYINVLKENLNLLWYLFLIWTAKAALLI